MNLMRLDLAPNVSLRIGTSVCLGRKDFFDQPVRTFISVGGIQFHDPYRHGFSLAEAVAA